jgi:hypothetical protein
MLRLFTWTNREPLKKVAGSGASFSGLGEIVSQRVSSVVGFLPCAAPIAPVLLGLAFCGRCRLLIRHDTLTPKRGRMLEDDAAIAGEVLIERNAVGSVSKALRSSSGRPRRSSPSSSISKAQSTAAWSRRRKRSASNAESPRSSTTISLAVDYARPHREVLDRGGDLRKAPGEIE